MSTLFISPVVPVPKNFTIGSLKEVIQPLLPQRLPCYDFTPIIGPTVSDAIPEGFRRSISGRANFRGVTGGVYKARERIHPGVLIQDY